MTAYYLPLSAIITIQFPSFFLLKKSLKYLGNEKDFKRPV